MTTIEEIEKTYETMYPKLVKLFCKDFPYYKSQELAQDVYVYALRKHSFFRNQCKVSSWLYIIAKGIRVDTLRKESFRSKELKRYFPDSIEHQTPEKALVDKTELTRLLFLIKKLPPQKKLCIMDSLNGIPEEKSAKKLNISLSAFKGRKFNIRKRLRQSI